ncbi:MAG: hypothetical protein HYV15_04005 [Elusimicrobia bacterium]|nr:hypothetical protein [Elusimicrobiota bacterium]
MLKLIAVIALSAAAAPGADMQAVLDGRDPVRAQMLKVIAAFEAHDSPAVVREADSTLKLEAKHKKLKPRELGLVYSMKGIAVLFEGKAKTALPLLEKASKLSGDSRTWYNLACAQSVLGKLPEAESSFRKSLEAGSKDGRFGDAAYYIGESRTDAQLAALRARPGYAKVMKEFGAKP